MTRNLSTADVSRILGLSEARVRELVRSGLGPRVRRGRRYAFTFQDLVVLRTAQGLLGQRVPATRVRRALAALVTQLPEDRPLSGLRIFADGRRVAVREGNAAWNPETGQTLLNFHVGELAAAVNDVPREAAPRGSDESATGRARREFERGVELEDLDPEGAGGAYRRALDLDPMLGDAYVNLGRITHEAGSPREAVSLYEKGLVCSPGDPILHFNLALALEDANRSEAAVAHYERALALDPDFADAHFNLAGVYEQLGRGPEALRHYHAYKKLTQA